jgi:hypothetical protein
MMKDCIAYKIVDMEIKLGLLHQRIVILFYLDRYVYALVWR